MAYTGAILIAFSAIKFINLRLHLMFDTSESIEEQPKDKHRQRHRDNQANRSVSNIFHPGYNPNNSSVPFLSLAVILKILSSKY